MADIPNAVEERKPWDLEFELSREPFEIDQICQLQNYVPR